MENEEHSKSKIGRREFAKNLSLSALLPTALVGGAAATAPRVRGAEPAAAAPAAAASGGKGAEMPDWAGKLGYSDMSATDDDGNHQKGFSDRSSTPKADDPKAPYRMPLTDEEKAILNGEKGPELAKVMAIVVAHGNAFGFPN